MNEINYGLADDTWGREEIEAINRVIKSNRFSMGSEVQAFEREFADYFGTKHAIMVNSGSSANLLAIAAMVYSERLKPGDEVIVPAVSWSTTYFPLAQHGLKLRFVDIDKDTLNIDLDKLEESITDKTKAVFSVNLLGNPVDYTRLKKVCSENDLLFLEDNCESYGASLSGKYAGTFGLLGTFSTFFSHHICTMEGGFVVTDDEELYHYMLSIRAHGWTRNLPENSMIYKKNSDSFYESFNFIMPGYNLRPIEMEAAIGREQLKKSEEILNNRRQNARYFISKLSGLSDLRIQKEVGKSSWFGFSIILDGKYKGLRDKFISTFNGAGIEVRPIVAGNFVRNKAVNFLDYTTSDNLANADYLHDNGFFLGNHSKVINNKIDKLYELLVELTS